MNAQTNTEGLRVISSNFSPLIIRDPDNTSDIFRINQSARVSGSATVQDGPYLGDPANASKIPILDSGGLIDQDLLPFKKGDLLPPPSLSTDRQTVETAVGTASYLSDYFSITELGITSAGVAANVWSGTLFGPNNDITGGAGLDDTDGDTYFDCDLVPQGNDCNDTNDLAFRDSTEWGFNNTGTWLACNANWTARPGDYNCDNTVEMEWYDGATGPLGPTLWRKVCDVLPGPCCESHPVSSCSSTGPTLDCTQTGINDIGRCFTVSSCEGTPILAKGYQGYCH